MLLAALTFLSLAHAAPACRVHVEASVIEKLNIDELLARNYRIEISGAMTSKEYLTEITEGDYGFVINVNDWYSGTVEGQIVQRRKGVLVAITPFSNRQNWNRVYQSLPDCIPR